MMGGARSPHGSGFSAAWHSYGAPSRAVMGGARHSTACSGYPVCWAVYTWAKCRPPDLGVGVLNGCFLLSSAHTLLLLFHGLFIQSGSTLGFKKLKLMALYSEF